MSTTENEEAVVPEEPKKKEERTQQMVEESYDAEFPMAKIVLGENVRSVLPNVTDMVTSIKAMGILEPLVGALLEDGKVRLIAGYRRYHAAQELKLATVPMRVMKTDVDFSQVAAMVENIQREGMNPMDIAHNIEKMMATQTMEAHVAARFLGRSEGWVSQHRSLLKLPKKIQAAVRSETIDLTTARQLTRVKDEEKALEFLKLAATLTAAGLADKIDFYLQKEKEKADKAEKAEKAKAKAAKKGKSSKEEPDEDAEPTLAELYGEKKLEPLKKTDMTAALQYYANKYDRAESETKKAEYKWILRGIEIASGLFEFTP